MKKNRIILMISLILLLLAAYMVNKSSSNTIDSDSSVFSISDTASVTKILLADKQNRFVILKRQTPGSWIVNDSFPALQENMEMLLQTMLRLEVKQPVPKTASENILKLLAANSTKVEIYQHAYRINLFNKIKWLKYEKLVKTYYVGFATQDNLGTFMLMEGADEPYIVHIQGFNGFLNTRYSTLTSDWRSHGIFSFNYNEIASVEVRNFSQPEESFKAVKVTPRSFSLISLQNPDLQLSYDTLRLMDLFGSFGDVRFEAIVQPENKTKFDSILQAPPYISINVVTIDGKEHFVKTQLIKMPEGYVSQLGDPVAFDRDRLYAHINGGKDFVLIQFYVFDKLFKPLSFYAPALNSNKTP